MNPYYTHQIYLKQELDNISKNKKQQKIHILELGIGDGSSSIFFEFCKDNPQASVEAFENNEQWVISMKSKYELPNYKINYIQDWNSLNYQNNNNYYDLIFIDQSPWEARIDALDKLYNKFSIGILHDYDYFNPAECKYCCDNNSYFKKYLDKYSIHGYFDILPPTMIMKHVDN